MTTAPAFVPYRAGAAATVHRPAPIIVVAMPSLCVTGRREAVAPRSARDCIMSDFPKPVTPREAKRVWDSQRRPDARNVAQGTRYAGRPVHFTTVARWKRQGWRTVATAQHPIEAATRALDVAIPLLTGDPTSTVKSFVDGKDCTSGLEEMADEQLQARTVREPNIALIFISEAMAQQCTVLIPNKTPNFAVLFKSLRGPPRLDRNPAVDVSPAVSSVLSFRSQALEALLAPSRSSIAGRRYLGDLCSHRMKMEQPLTIEPIMPLQGGYGFLLLKQEMP